MAIIGVYMLVSGTTKSEFMIYRLLVARSRILWGEGDAVNRFYQLSHDPWRLVGAGCRLESVGPLRG